MNRAEPTEAAFPRLFVPQAPPVRRWADLVGPAVMLGALALVVARVLALFWR